MTTTNIPVMAGPSRGSYFDWRSWLFWLIMAVWSIPLLWLVSMSLRFNEDIVSKFEIIPSRISFRGYV
jgi:ABC-type glycerol-3-phosphate transport system permease component